MDASKRRFYYKQNRLKQLRAFCYAAESRSISRAAERMFQSQPSVSLQVRSLEQELGTKLFERHGPRIELTPEGRLLHELAVPLVEGIEGLVDTFAARRGMVEAGELDIAASEVTTLYILPRYMQQFMRDYPQVQLRIHNVTERDSPTQLRSDEVEFAVGSMLEVPPDISFHPIFTYDTVLITPPDHPLAKKRKLTLADISATDLVLQPRHLSTWRMIEGVFRQADLPYRVVLEVGGSEVVKKYVELGLGVSIVTSICLTGEERLAVRPLGDLFPRRSYGVIQRRGRFLTAAARRFIEMMDAEFFSRGAVHSPG